jgi:dGTPase
MIAIAGRAGRCAVEWRRLLDDTRFGGVASLDGTRGRSEFQKDHDRIIFSEAFRKLGRKTQVHPLPKNDRVHNRLTHSLEVSCVGRSLGEMCGRRLAAMGELPAHIAPSDIGAIVQAACLAHDIGNPPFGHAGEYAVRDWYRRTERARLSGISDAAYRDLSLFEGNAQGLRMLTTLVETVGIRLTHATLATFVKYPWSSAEAAQHRGKYSYYESERDAFTRVFDTLGITRHAPGVYARHPLAYFVEAADDICYALIDIEDGYEMGVLGEAEVTETLLPLLSDADRDEYERDEAGFSTAQRFRRLRGRAVDNLIGACVDAFFADYDAILAGRFSGSIVDRAPVPIRDGIAHAKFLAKDKIFLHSRKMELEIGAYAAVGTLLEACAALIGGDSGDDGLRYRTSRLETMMGEFRPDRTAGADENARSVTDFVASLTDNQVTRLAQVIRGNTAE